ncbi:hypothetical protein, partial [Planktotalea frisia]|uniref:hypothetical protein n=1 Tax=Planktotalea frisia TaxID=696762 RepID=UPI002357E4B8
IPFQFSQTHGLFKSVTAQVTFQQSDVGLEMISGEYRNCLKPLAYLRSFTIPGDIVRISNPATLTPLLEGRAQSHPRF